MRALKLRVCGEDLQAQTVTTQAREGIETAHQRYRRSSLAVTTQAREGIETGRNKSHEWRTVRNNSNSTPQVTTQQVPVPVPGKKQAHEGIETQAV